MAAVAERLLGPVREAARRARLAEFLAWWTGEMLAMLPPPWRERFTARSAGFVRIDGDAWQELRGSPGNWREANRADFATLDIAGRRAAFRRLVAGGPGDAGNVWLVLPEQEVLIRTASLPAAAEEALRDAIGFELDRFTPFTASQAYFDYRVVSRDAAAQRVQILLAVASHEVVDRRLAELREVGATVVGVCPAQEPAGAATPLNLLEEGQRGRPAVSRSAFAARALAAVALVLALAALILPLWQKRSTVITLLPRMYAAKAQADVSERLAKDIEVLAAEHNFVTTKKLGQVPMVHVIEELSRLLPDGTWIQQLEIKPGPKGRDLQCWGETASSSQLIEVLEKSGLVANASFRSPLTKGATPGTERYFVGGELKARPIPEPLPDSALAGPAPPPGGPASVAAPARPATAAGK